MVVPRYLRFTFALTIAALLIGVPLWYQSARDKRYRNFRVVEEGVLYRSGQMSLDGLRRVLEQKGIKTVISLRDGKSAPDQREEEYCKRQGIEFVRIVQQPWGSDDGSVPNEEGVRRFLEVVGDKNNHPVLLHCFAGHHRTGAHCAIFRMERHGWSSPDAIEEMYRLGYDTIEGDLDVYWYLRNYRGRAH